MVNAGKIGTSQAATQHEYGPFGELLRATGPMAKVNPFRFSTKYQDDESDLVYYGHRYYNPSTGRWLNRDPINELGFKVLTRKRNRFNRNEEENLYRFVKNRPLTFCDPVGNDLTSTVVGTIFPDSWAVSGPDPQGNDTRGWYAVHCAAHCFWT